MTPVGRLDKETEGLLLLTNDGDLAHRLLSPRSGVWKTYYAEHEGTASAEDCAAFEAGLTLGDGTKCLRHGWSRRAMERASSMCRRAKYHQVRRMMAARGMPVTYLKRIAEGG
ncbi:MAG: pseudouridine synthase, partial [Oscillospiraceae bacterium]